MHITPISADVRIVYHGSPSHEIVIERQDAGQWSRAGSYNEMSNDWAHTEATRHARQLAESIRQGAARVTAATIESPRIVRVLGADARMSSNDEPDETERGEVARGFAIARGVDPYGQAAADRAQQDELHMLRCRGGL